MTQTWLDADLVVYVEDDHLVSEDAFAVLVESAAKLPEASYFSLSGDQVDTTEPADRAERSSSGSWAPAPDLEVAGRTWVNAVSNTRTFGGRVGALRADMPVFLAGTAHLESGGRDTCAVYQGIVPYHGLELVRGPADTFVRSVRGVLEAVRLLPYRVRLNQLARSQRTPHLLYDPSPKLAVRLDDPAIAADREWVAVAAGVADWAERHELRDPATTIRQTLREAA